MWCVQALKDVNKEVQILQCHGDSDPIVPYKWGQLSASILKTFAKNTEFRSYRGLMHTSSEEVNKLIHPAIETSEKQGKIKIVAV